MLGMTLSAIRPWELSQIASLLLGHVSLIVSLVSVGPMEKEYQTMAFLVFCCWTYLLIPLSFAIVLGFNVVFSIIYFATVNANSDDLRFLKVTTFGGYLVATHAVALVLRIFLERESRKEFLVHRANVASREAISKDRDRSAKLLGSCLPASIVAKLRGATGELLATNFELLDSVQDEIPECSVLFCDIVGFTSLSSKLKAQDTVDMLRKLFIAFEKSAYENQCDPLKSLGDCFVIATRKDPAEV